VATSVLVATPAFTHAVQNGPLIVAAGVALLVGVLGFLSPCVLPLVPGYLSYVAGLSNTATTGTNSETSTGSTTTGSTGAGSTTTGSTGATLVDARTATVNQRRLLFGSLLFVAGFSVIFIAEGVLFGSLGAAIRDHRIAIERVLGGVTIVLGLAFMGWIPALQREFRIHRRPPAGLIGAPLLGAAFGLAWSPCLTPTLSVVYSMSYTQGSAGRGSILMAFYCLGLGIPFVLVALGFGWVSGALGFVRRHRAAVSRIGGGLLVAMGLLLITGTWDQFADWLRQEFGGATGVGSGL
jgi:cytochrome c-type biogenesis protein